ncbi:hypothetical protein ACLBWZ_17215 [Brucellaceae bacterium C25G]
MFIRIYIIIFFSLLLSACSTTEAEKDAKITTPRIPLSDGTAFVQRATPASTCRQKYNEVNRVDKILNQEGFVKRGKGEILVFKYQITLLSDFVNNCKNFIARGG